MSNILCLSENSLKIPLHFDNHHSDSKFHWPRPIYDCIQSYYVEPPFLLLAEPFSVRVASVPLAMSDPASKAAQLAIEKHADSGRRLVEYFVVVSSVPDTPDNAPSQGEDTIEWKPTKSFEEDEFEGHNYRPKITARFPVRDHADNPLHDNLMCFCHPTGMIRLRKEPVMPKVSDTRDFRYGCRLSVRQ